MDGGGEILGRAVKKKNVEPVYSKFVFFFFMLNLHQPRFTTTDCYLLSRGSNTIRFRSRKKKSFPSKTISHRTLLLLTKF